MDKFPQMLYRLGGDMQYEGNTFSTLVVSNEGELSDALANGWSESTTQAVEASKPVEPADNAPPTRAEMESKATELGLKFDGRTSDKKLGELIAAAVA